MKRYQVFLSSTYEDLKEERNEVLQALLELDCIPSGMEYFPATDDTQWNYIKGLIEICDYYMVVIGGRYGSEDENGMSYTEKEYRYALSQNIPVIAFYHNSPENLPVNKTDNDNSKKEKLKSFKKLVQKKLCKSWENKDQLGAIASRSMSQLIKSHPRTGWVRANQPANEKVISELLEAKETIEKLNFELKEYKDFEIDTNELSNEDDIINLSYFIRIEEGYNSTWKIAEDEKFTWNQLFDAISTKLNLPLVSSSFNSHLNQYLNDLFTIKHRKHFETIDKLLETGIKKIDLRFSDESLEQIKIQFIALRLITEKIELRGKKRTRVLELSKLGHYKLIKRKAMKKHK